jgi:hypothetical protein
MTRGAMAGMEAVSAGRQRGASRSIIRRRMPSWAMACASVAFIAPIAEARSTAPIVSAKELLDSVKYLVLMDWRRLGSPSQRQRNADFAARVA